MQTQPVSYNISDLNDIPEDCQVIIYLPIQRHYVVLAGVDDEEVWIIDMDNRKFLYNMEIDKFNRDIELGAYLLISNQPLILDDNLIEIEDEQLNQFTGGETGYCCTEKIQEADTGLCSEMTYGMCLSVYTVWSELYKCETCEGSGECFGEPHISSYWSVCIIDPDSLEFCIIDGEWRAQYARACMSVI